jgi:hypothetical protein
VGGGGGGGIPLVDGGSDVPFTVGGMVVELLLPKPIHHLQQ